MRTKALGARSFLKRRRRRRNPARKARVTTTTTRTRIVRRGNPRRPIYALVARRKGAGAGGKILRFTGTKFSDHAKAKLFSSLEELRAWAGRLRREHGTVLKHYDLYSQTRYVK
ncbi:MAG: hypothetical protein ACRDLF_16255 [Solirubrobacteraceae bacterium]